MSAAPPRPLKAARPPRSGVNGVHARPGRFPLTSLSDRRWPRVAAAFVLGAVLMLWIVRIWLMITQSGLFTAVGYDFGLYLAQVAALQSGDPTNIYRLDVLNAYQQALAAYAPPGTFVPPALVPYPPLFAWLLQPLTLVPPPVAFLIWTGLNLAAMVALVWRIRPLVPDWIRPWLLGLVVVFPGVIPSLVLGQPMLLLALATAEFYVSLRAGRELRAGLWLACLFFKPQYGLLVGLLLVWKARWSAVTGALLGGLVVLIGSAVVAGVPAVLAYPHSLVDTASFRADITNPLDMVNWRSLVVLAQTLIPSIGDRLALGLILVPSAVSVGVLGLIWRGPWNVRERLWPARMAALWMATLIVSYHSHLHGLTLLVLPLTAALATPGLSSRTRWILAVGMVVPGVLEPVLLFVPTLRHVPSWLLALSMAAGLASILVETRETWQPRRLRAVLRGT